MYLHGKCLRVLINTSYLTTYLVGLLSLSDIEEEARRIIEEARRKANEIIKQAKEEAKNLLKRDIGNPVPEEEIKKIKSEYEKLLNELTSSYSKKKEIIKSNSAKKLKLIAKEISQIVSGVG